MQLIRISKWKTGAQALLFSLVAVQGAGAFASSDGLNASEFRLAVVSPPSMVASADTLGGSALPGGDGFQGGSIAAQLPGVDADVEMTSASAVDNGLVSMAWIAVAAVLGFSVIARRQPSSGPQSNHH